MGDLSRRLGEFDEARTTLEAVELDTGAAEETRSYARDVLAVLKVQAKAPAVGGEPAPSPEPR